MSFIIRCLMRAEDDRVGDADGYNRGGGGGGGGSSVE